MARRAQALPPDERRAALVAATLPLIGRHGAAVSTRQIAEAAGVAEGTIYRAFPDKDSLIQATLAAAFDPEPVVRRLADLNPDASLEDRVTEAVRILQERLAEVFNLVAAFGLHGPPRDQDHAEDSPRPWRPGSERTPSAGRAAGDHAHPRSNAAVHRALTEVFAPHAGKLRMPPAQCARVLRLVVFAGSHPRVTDNDPLSTEEIVDLVLHGIACPSPKRPSSISPTGDRSC